MPTENSTLEVDREGGDADAILREAMAALEMPRAGVARWLDHLERFYRRHGAERHYGECLALVQSMRRLLAEEAAR